MQVRNHLSSLTVKSAFRAVSLGHAGIALEAGTSRQESNSWGQTPQAAVLGPTAYPLSKCLPPPPSAYPNPGSDPDVLSCHNLPVPQTE
jgi:hypothetical protein